ncbi:hypothetical protein SAMN04488515_2955 [Cognatiyoonia koreensis]|uniref:Uncharacterized protein n=1 Tax=Cognatiyoonia koreensis TaxID=364200 RepID=A0A1I0RP11_9RHOB|nr:hypothetical protein SAMN04488515_2955 [Cognatiyoonia koreensis]
MRMCSAFIWAKDSALTKPPLTPHRFTRSIVGMTALVSFAIGSRAVQPAYLLKSYESRVLSFSPSTD